MKVEKLLADRELFLDGLNDNGPGISNGAVNIDDIRVHTPDDIGDADAQKAGGSTDGFDGVGIASHGEVADFADTAFGFATHGTVFAREALIALEGGGVGGHQFQAAGPVLDADARSIGDDHLSDFTSGAMGAAIDFAIHDDAHTDTFVDTDEEHTTAIVHLGAAEAELGEGGGADIVIDEYRERETFFQVFLDIDPVPGASAAEFDDTVFVIDDTADTDADAVGATGFEVCVEKRDLLDNHIQRALGRTGCAEAMGFEDLPLEISQGDAGFPLADIDANGTVVGLIEFQAGTGTAAGGVFRTLLEDEALLEQIGRNTRDRAFREAGAPSKLGAGNLRELTQRLQNESTIGSANLCDALRTRSMRAALNHRNLTW